MSKKLALAALAAVVAVPTIMPAPAFAHSEAWYREHHYYYGDDRHYHRCSGGNGAVGTVAGGVGGAVLGSAVGGGALGTVAGGVGGALLGRHLDKVNTRHRAGC